METAAIATIIGAISLLLTTIAGFGGCIALVWTIHKTKFRNFKFGRGKYFLECSDEPPRKPDQPNET